MPSDNIQDIDMTVTGKAKLMALTIRMFYKINSFYEISFCLQDVTLFHDNTIKYIRRE